MGALTEKSLSFNGQTMKGSNNFHFKTPLFSECFNTIKFLPPASLTRNYIYFGKLGQFVKIMSEPDCSDLDTVSHDNDSLIVTDDSCLILINSNNWNKGVSLQQSFPARHLWTTKSLVFKYAKLSSAEARAQPLYSLLSSDSVRVSSMETTKQRKIRKRLVWDETAVLKVEKTWLWLSSSEAIWGLAYLVLDLRHF